MKRRLYWVLILLLPIGAWASTSTTAWRHDYQVLYRGTLSLGEDMPIADLVLQAPGAAAAMHEIHLEASSAAYPLVESVYPIRYRFRSWSAAENGHLIGFESFERTGRQRHRLYLRDGPGVGVRRFDLLKGAGQAEMAALGAGQRPAAADAVRQLYDRLGLLQMLRTGPLHDQAEYRVPVTNGRESLEYRVKVEGSQVLQIGGRPVASWKLRFDGDEVAADGARSIAHRPVFIWLSQDTERIPLRAEVRHPIGLFRVEWRPTHGTGRLARAGR